LSVFGDSLHLFKNKKVPETDSGDLLSLLSLTHQKFSVHETLCSLSPGRGKCALREQLNFVE